MTHDDRLLDALKDAVGKTMKDIEAEMQTRVRKNGQNENRLTGNMAWGEFIHFTSRPVDGVPCPHLHAHCFAFNTTWDNEEQAFKAGQFRDLKRDAPYFEAVFHSRLAESLGQLGLRIERHAKGWELAGFDPKTIRDFSRRTTQIEDLARKQGILDPAKKAELGAKTRAKKAKQLSFAQLQENWQERLNEQDAITIESFRKQPNIPQSLDPLGAKRGIKYAIDHAFERNSVISERQLLAIALRSSVGQANVQQILDEGKRAELIRGERAGRSMVTTREVLAEERKVIALARVSRGSYLPYVSRTKGFEREWLNDSQKAAVRHILKSRDGIMIVRGVAGVGKTTLMKEAVESIQESGTSVFAFAPSADASRGVLRAAGFENADTVARLLVDENLQAQASGQLIWIDEAGQLSMPDMRQVFELAQRIHARVLLSGDKRQHGSVERGSALRLLEEEAGLVPAEVKEIQRQTGRYKAAVRSLSEGHIDAGYRELESMGWVREVADDDRYSLMARDYVTAIESGQTALVVSPTHAEGDRITDEIRDRLKRSGKIKDEERTFETLESTGLTQAERSDWVNYQSGDLIQFYQNAKGFKRGQRLEINDLGNIPFDQSARFQHFRKQQRNFAVGDRIRITNNGATADGQHKLNNGAIYTINRFTDNGNIILKENGWEIDKDYGHLTHGFCVTSQASQGKSVQQVFIGQSSWSFAASSREQFYVSVSRGEKQATIYTDNKHSLQEAIQQSEDRISATEFVTDAIRHGRIYTHLPSTREIEADRSRRSKELEHG